MLRTSTYVMAWLDWRSTLASWRRGARRRFVGHRNSWLVFGAVVLIVSGFSALLHSTWRYQTDLDSVTCLARNVYFEARGEPEAGQYAVAEVTMNRLASGLYPSTVCGVVYEKRWDWLRRRYVGAFSWTELDRRPSLEDKEWVRAQMVAVEVYYRRQPQHVNGALLYHATYILPNWAEGKKPVAQIGRHVFYK